MGEGRRRDPWSGSSRLGSVQREAPGDPGRTTDVPRESWHWTEAMPRDIRTKYRGDTTTSWGHYWGNLPLLSLLLHTPQPTGQGIGKTEGERVNTDQGPHAQLVEPHIQPAERTTWVLTRIYTIKMKRVRSLRITLRLMAVISHPGR